MFRVVASVLYRATCALGAAAVAAAVVAPLATLAYSVFGALGSASFEIELWVVALLVVAGFVAGFVDAIAGGGGMVQTLSLLLAGLPPVTTLATNKVVSMMGTATAVSKFAKEKVVNWYLVSACIIPCLIASAIGSRSVMLLNDFVINLLIIICIPIALIVGFVPSEDKGDQPESRSRPAAIAALSPLAFYDGLIGPGTGTYMAIAANRILNVSFLRATAIAKPLNLATNVGSAVVYIAAGKVLWLVAVPMAVANMAGAYLGSHYAIKHGDGFIKKVMLLMLAAMLVVNLIKILS